MTYYPGQEVEYNHFGRDGWRRVRVVKEVVFSDGRTFNYWDVVDHLGREAAVSGAWLRPVSPLVALAEVAE